MKVLIIDSHNMLHRARCGVGDGEHKIYFNFFRMLSGELKRHEPDITYIVDEGRPTQSLQLSADFKATRTKLADPQFHREKAEIFETIQNTSGLVYIQHPDFEADDVIAYVANDVHPDDEVMIVSSDTDFIQLISERVKLWEPRKKIFVEQWKHVDYVTWKALRGDMSDNVPGVKGVGAKTADKLCCDGGQLQEFLDAKPNRRHDFETSYSIIKLKNVPQQGLQVVQSDFLVDTFFEEFSKRKCKSIIGKAWPGWIQRFSDAGGKHAAN